MRRTAGDKKTVTRTAPSRVDTFNVTATRVRADRRGARATPRHSNIFISYRRDDSTAHARHLFESLAARFGEQRVFFDQNTIEPGAAFPKRIEAAIKASGVMLVVIGQRWLEPLGDTEEPRLSKARDWVRREIELGLRGSARVIPVLVDGAIIPDKNELPPSLAALPTLNAITVQWHESVAELSKTIAEVTDPGTRYDLTEHLRDRSKAMLGRATILTAMEISLAHQGETVTLDDKDLAKKFQEVTNRALDTGTTMKQIMYVIDRVGLAGQTGRGARRVYTARAYRLKSRSEIATNSKGPSNRHGNHCLQEVVEPQCRKTGLIEDWKEPGAMQGVLLSAIVGFDPGDGCLRFMTYFPDWGQRGLGTLTASAAKRFMADPASMYSIEATKVVTLSVSGLNSQIDQHELCSR